MIPISSTFTAACSHLNIRETGLVLRFLIRFHGNPAHPSLSLERVVNARSDNIWSARLNDETRVILKKEGESWIAVYVGLHDDAYRWAMTHEVGRHPVTHHWQVVEMPVVAARPVATPPRARSVLARFTDQYLLSLGLPESWLPVLRPISDRTEFDHYLDRLPDEVAIRLLDLVDGRQVELPTPVSSDAPLKDLQSVSTGLVIVQSDRQLEAILNEPMAKWIAFLHPSQKKLVEAPGRGPVKVTGSAGTGKTVAAMHRARHLASLGHRVLVTSFVQTLCHNIKRNLHIFCTDEEMERIDVINVHRMASEILSQADQHWTALSENELLELIHTIKSDHPAPLDSKQLLIEWVSIIEHQGIETWKEYQSANRSGRGRALSVRERREVWNILDLVRQRLEELRQTTWEGLCRRAAALLPTIRSRRGGWLYDAVVVDELQDLKPQELHFIARLAPVRNLFLAGDAGQQIYPGRITLNSIGVDVRGRSTVLRVNYRTTEQIRTFADGILTSTVDDLDGGTESRVETRSLLRGSNPVIRGFQTRADQYNFVTSEIERLLKLGYSLDSIGVFARQSSNLGLLRQRFNQAGIPFFELKKDQFPQAPAVNIGTMHRAKGLEFKVVFVVDLDDLNMPNQKAITSRADHVMREEALILERQLLYVSVTRARDLACLTWAGTPSRFLTASG